MYCELGRKQTTERQRRPILIKNVQNWDIVEYHIGSLVLSHWYYVESHFISQKLRQVSGGCIPRSYVLWIGQKWNTRGKESHFIWMIGSNFLISRGETNFWQVQGSIATQHFPCRGRGMSDGCMALLLHLPCRGSPETTIWSLILDEFGNKWWSLCRTFNRHPAKAPYMAPSTFGPRPLF